ncbi:MAG: Glutathione import ATP-binding protein GsiA [Chlamydiales bacterium]|nr:Glutathione import ATP-binding protein GsiA [Chlamydiales bacterium]MCH9619699.1 Glutathione import ATP-binding protein GsiA [Chlamydiales bacterium]MCH9623305.1 Glutathione import ATP-binding protein GsiA [Chlamydiales bacterium]
MNQILEVKNLKKHFPIKRGFFRKPLQTVRAVNGISFTIGEKEIVGLVGESGCGKSTAARCLTRLIEPSSGEISFLDEDLLSLRGKELRAKRREMQMVFQDPLASLNPRKTILENIGEALLYHRLLKSRDAQIEQVSLILKKIGIAENALGQYPHQFSGGQQQRISIGRAIALKPRLLICDEAVSALDLSVQAQILNLLYDLKHQFKLSYLFISHDLTVVQSLCDRILVMHQGEIVEEGSREAIFEDPKHPYTKKLLSSLPSSHPLERSNR